MFQVTFQENIILVLMPFVLLTFDNAASLPVWVVVVSFGIPFFGGLALYIYKTRHARSWRKGIFPQSLKPNEDNFLEAYLALGAKLILLDYHEAKGKTQYINEYFNRYFTKANYNFGDSLLFSLKYPIQTKTITDWMQMYLQSEGKKSQVIYFLTGLALVAGGMNSNELNFLKKINADLGLPPENLTQIIATYASYQQHRKSTESKHKTQTTTNIKYYHEILGVTSNATQEEIKKAYRKLAKVHHPDNFATGTESQQKMAAEKFMEIQKAFDELSKR